MHYSFRSLPRTDRVRLNSFNWCDAMSQIGYEMTTNVVESRPVITSVIYPLSCCCQIYINELFASRQDYEDPYSTQETVCAWSFTGKDARYSGSTSA